MKKFCRFRIQGWLLTCDEQGTDIEIQNHLFFEQNSFLG